ncbi:MAG: hypothetical protein R3272_09195 [Candidatus Promineifilaceae bacterium]|nr:hypothetical protein [Candidatus Promineifilaceae bacterium]
MAEATELLNELDLDRLSAEEAVYHIKRLSEAPAEGVGEAGYRERLRVVFALASIAEERLAERKQM